VTTTPHLDPLPFDQIAAGCSSTIYGVPVSFLGEEQDGMAAFTLDRRRALAAMNALVRREIDEPFRELYDLSSLKSRWVLAYGHCGCEHKDPHACRGDLNGPVTCCRVDPDDPDGEDIDNHECEHYGLPPCIEDLYSFVSEDVAEGTPGAFLVWRVSQ
jgi:hypothetical protein